MKHGLHLLLCLSLYTLSIQSSNSTNNQATQSKPNQPLDDDIDGQVVLANVAIMLNSLGTISTDPHNPAVLGPNLAQIGIGFLNIITQIFKNIPLNDEITDQHMEEYFSCLSPETKNQLLSLLLPSVNAYRKGTVCRLQPKN